MRGRDSDARCWTNSSSALIRIAGRKDSRAARSFTKPPASPGRLRVARRRDLPKAPTRERSSLSRPRPKARSRASCQGAGGAADPSQQDPGPGGMSSRRGLRPLLAEGRRHSHTARCASSGAPGGSRPRRDRCGRPAARALRRAQLSVLHKQRGYVTTRAIRAGRAVCSTCCRAGPRGSSRWGAWTRRPRLAAPHRRRPLANYLLHPRTDSASTTRRWRGGSRGRSAALARRRRARDGPRCPGRRACCAPTEPPPGLQLTFAEGRKREVRRYARRWGIRCGASSGAVRPPRLGSLRGGPARSIDRRLSMAALNRLRGGTLRLYCVGSTDRSASGAL